MPYPKVSAAEKYAEIGGRENAPKCEHGEPKSWGSFSGCRAGGSWRCQCGARTYMAQRSIGWRAAGLCSGCGQKPPRMGFARCEQCAEAQAKHSRFRYHTNADSRLRKKMKSTIYLARIRTSAALRNPEPDRDTEVIGVAMPIVNLRRN